MTTVASQLKNFYLEQAYQDIFPLVQYADYFNNRMPGSVCSMITEDIFTSYLNTAFFPNLITNQDYLTATQYRQEFRLYGDKQYLAAKISYEDYKHNLDTEYDISKIKNNLIKPLYISPDGKNISVGGREAYVSTKNYSKKNQEGWIYGRNIIFNKTISKNNTRKKFKVNEELRIPLNYYLSFCVSEDIQTLQHPVIKEKYCILQNINDFIINTCDIKKCNMSDVRPEEHFYFLDLSFKITEGNRDTLYPNNKIHFYEFIPLMEFYQINNIKPFTNKFIEVFTSTLMNKGGII